jgi:hypothetical protein
MERIGRGIPAALLVRAPDCVDMRAGMAIQKIDAPLTFSSLALSS